MNVWDALQQLCEEDNPRLFVMVEIEDARQIMALREALRAVVTRGTEKKLNHARELLGMRPKR